MSTAFVFSLQETGIVDKAPKKMGGLLVSRYYMVAGTSAKVVVKFGIANHSAIYCPHDRFVIPGRTEYLE